MDVADDSLHVVLENGMCITLPPQDNNMTLILEMEKSLKL